jgi:hypothetical protein
MKRHFFALVLTGILILAAVGPALAANSNPGVIPNKGHKYGELGAQWWQWASSFPYADIPYFNPGGPVDISAHQSGNVWFLAGAAFGLGPVTRTGVVPAGTQLFFPLGNVINDYPCPEPPPFQPDPGETMEHFLQRTGNGFLDDYLGIPHPPTSVLPDLFATIDGAPLSDLSAYRATSSLFMFTADPALASYDSCITGTPQPGVAVGYWLLVTPLTPGTHTLHFGAPAMFQDITYILTVKPGH